MRHFPHTVQLSRDHQDAGLAVISVSVNEPEEEAQVLTVLQELDAQFTNLISQHGLSEKTLTEFKVGQAIPYFQLYDRQGNLRYVFGGDADSGEEPLDMIDQRVEELLAEKI